MLSSVAMLTSCGDDDGAPVSQTPADDIEGLYTGTWTVVKSSSSATTTETHSGTVDLTKVSTFSMKVTTSIPDIESENSKSAPVNVVATSDGYMFYCTVLDRTINPYGLDTTNPNSNPQPISGKVTGNTLAFTYTMQTKVGRTVYGMSYSFTGTKYNPSIH